MSELHTRSKDPRLERAVELLREYRPEPPIGSEEDVLARIERPHGWPVWAQASVAVAASVLVLFGVSRMILPEPSPTDAAIDGPRLVSGHLSGLESKQAVKAGEPLPREGWWVAADAVTIELADGRAHFDAKSIFRIVDAPPMQEIRLFRGRVGLEASKPSPMTRLVTQQAELTRIGRKVILSADRNRTTVRAVEGVTKVLSTQDGRVHRVEARADLEITARSAVNESKPIGTAEPPKASGSEARPSSTKAVEAAPAETPRASEPVSATPLVAERASARLDLARASLVQDAPAAQRIAESILEEAPEPRIEAGALAVLADAYRRNGHTDDAADTYRRVANHPEGRPYAEEALYRRAQLLAELGKQTLALAALERAHTIAPSGPLAPERETLRADLLEAMGRSDEAEAALDSALKAARAQGDLATAKRLEARREKTTTTR